MFESIKNFFKKKDKENIKTTSNSKEAAKERLHLVLMQDRANVSADFLELMKQEIIEVIKKYIDVDERAIDVRLTNKENEDGTNGAPALYANIPILNIKNEARKMEKNEAQKNNKTQENNKLEANNKTQVSNKSEEINDIKALENNSETIIENIDKKLEDLKETEQKVEEAKELISELDKKEAEKKETKENEENKSKANSESTENKESA